MEGEEEGEEGEYCREHILTDIKEGGRVYI